MTDTLPSVPGEFLLYETEDGRTRVECRFLDETLWLSQAGMAELFQTCKQNIAKHLRALFAEGELAADAVVNQWLTTAQARQEVNGRACARPASPGRRNAAAGSSGLPALTPD